MYQLGQHGQGAAEGASGGSGRPVVKCCNVIKSCVITPDEQLCEETRGGAVTKANLVVGAQSPPKQDALAASGNPTRGNRSPPQGSKHVAKSVVGSSASKPGAIRNSGDGAVDNGAVAEALVDRRPAEVEVSTPGRPAAEGGPFDEGARQDEKGNDTCFAGAEIAKDKIKPTQRRNIFVDETVTSFFRRLTWTPDGAFLITPTAQNWDATARKTRFCTYLFTRGQFFK